MMLTKRLTTRAVYRQLRDVLAARIATGQWKPGTALPSEADLAREFQVSPGTARKALQLLEAERLLTRRQGHGTFVTDPASAERALRYCKIHTSGGAPIVGAVRVLDVSEAPASEVQRSRLHLRPDDRVCRVQLVRLQNGGPFMVEEISMPSSLFPGLAERKDFSSPLAGLAQEFGILVGRAEERLSVGAASPVAAHLLGLDVGAPVLALDRLVYAIDGAPVEWRLCQANLADKYYEANVD
jgi:GntR family transcriptional regulator